MLTSPYSHRSLSHTRGSFVPVNEGSVINYNSYHIIINAPPAPLPGVHNPTERLNVSVMCGKIQPGLLGSMFENTVD